MAQSLAAIFISPEYLAHQATQFSMPHVILIPNHFAGALDEASFCPWWTLSEHLTTRFGRPYDDLI